MLKTRQGACILLLRWTGLSWPKDIQNMPEITPACNRVFSCGIMAAVLVSLNKGTANLPGIELCYHANIFFCFCGIKQDYRSHERKHSSIHCYRHEVLPRLGAKAPHLMIINL